VASTLGKPPGETTHWMAEMMPKSGWQQLSSVQRIWRTHGLQPHRVRRFKLSRDPEFVPKLWDILGLYVDPPAHAVVLSVDEKSQIQALDRTQPGLPLKPGRLGTMTHDYKRNGTITLLAALGVLEGKLIGRCMQRHRHQEFIRFLNTIEAEVPGRQDRPGGPRRLRQPQTLQGAGLARPTAPVCVSLHAEVGLRLNAVEGFFGKLTKRRFKRVVFRSLVDLQATINRFLAEANDNRKPFVWSADPDKIMAAVRLGTRHWSRFTEAIKYRAFSELCGY
jgi:hypothetical protein